MSEMIVQVRNKMLRRIGGVNHFVSHNKDYTIQFQFDESWDNVRTKMAVFAYEDGEYGSEIFDGDTCNVPELPREGRILIGVKAGEDLSTELLCIPVCKSADDVITDEYDEPDPKIYEQILDIINNLWNGGTTVYPSPVKFLASPSAAKVGDLIRVKEVDENGDVTRTEGFDVGVELEKKINAPQVAQVGEVLTVEEVDADGKPKKWKTQTIETAPPDWMENDSNNPGFVKNRTHYKQIINGPGNPGYKVNLLDGTHRVGDIILLQSVTTNSLQKFLMRGINSPDWDVYELCMLIKETDNNDKTYNLEVICKDRENIVEVNTLSEGNIKVLYSEQKKALLAYYFISNLSTLSTEDKTKFTQTGVYVQLAGNDYSEYAELWATYRLYLYTKLSNKYLNIKQNPPIPQPLRGNEMIATEQTGKNEFGYTLRPIPTINDFIDLGITAAQVGQIIKIKSVNNFGNPHEWEAVDKEQICCPQKTTKECGESETITLANNAEYRLTNVTALTFAYPENDFECWIRLTISKSGDVAVVLPEGTKYIGSAPTFANGEMWEISIKDGVVIAQKVGDGT